MTYFTGRHGACRPVRHQLLENLEWRTQPRRVRRCLTIGICCHDGEADEPGYPPNARTSSSNSKLMDLLLSLLSYLTGNQNAGGGNVHSDNDTITIPATPAVPLAPDEDTNTSTNNTSNTNSGPRSFEDARQATLDRFGGSNGLVNYD